MHYYIQKGFRLDYLLGLGLEEKLFYYASMEKSLEDQAKLMEGLGGG